MPRRPDNLRQLQAAAAIGQAYLIRAYDEGFRRHGRHAAQLLLTHEDFGADDATRRRLRPGGSQMLGSWYGFPPVAVALVRRPGLGSLDDPAAR